MQLASLFEAFSAYLHSDSFRASARHRDHPSAFTRDRKLPLPTLIAGMLCGMRKSVQAELDEFFAHLQRQAQLVRHVSAQAFAKARAKLAHGAISQLNTYLLQKADEMNLIPRWLDLRLIAADASALRFGLRASHVPRAAQSAQIAFALFLPGAELTLNASLHGTYENERQMLFEHLDALGKTDLLLLDRGYPARWLVAALNQRDIRFCMRVDSSGFACVKQFIRSGLPEQTVTLPAPSKRDSEDYECPCRPQNVRLVRNIAPNGKIRVLMTNLLDGSQYPAAAFADLYHQRWSIEEAFKRIKHRLCLEHVTGLSQLAVCQDFAAKILCDNIQSLLAHAAHRSANLDELRRINHAYAHTTLKPVLPLLLLGLSFADIIQQTITLIARQTYRHRPGRSKPRPQKTKPHKSMTQKAC